MNRSASWLVLLLMTVSATTTSVAQEADASRIPSLIVLIPSRAETLDPHATSSGGDFAVLQHVYETLVLPAKSAGETERSCLARKWETSDDFKTWRFDLREGVRFHDGSTLNAQVVRSSLLRLIDPNHKAAPGSSPYREEFANVRSIEAEGQLQVVFHLNEPDTGFLALLSMPAAVILSQSGLDSLAALPAGKRRAGLNGTTRGTGPFKRVKQAEQVDTSVDFLELEAHDTYWAGKPTVALLRFKTLTDGVARAKAVQKGEADLAEWPANSMWLDLEKDPSVHLARQPANSICYLAMNCTPEGKQPTADIRVRKAIAMAIDRTSLLEGQNPGAHPLHTLLPPSMLGHPKDFKPENDRLERAEAIKQAKALVQQAGAGSTQLSMLVPSVSRPYLQHPTQFAEKLRMQLAEIGLDVTIELAPMAEMVARMSKRDYALMLIGWMGASLNQPDQFWNLLLSGTNGPSDNNPAGFYDDTVAQEVEKARSQPTLLLRAKGFEALERSVHDKFRPIVPLAWNETAWVWRGGLSGVEAESDGRLSLRNATRK